MPSCLPGYSFNVATLVHGYEALLAAGFIFTVHFFNGHLRWEKFPLDEVIFTGRLSEEEFKEERPLEYERLVASGGLDALRVEPAPRWQHRLARVVAIVAVLFGLSLVVLVLAAWLL